MQYTYVLKRNNGFFIYNCCISIGFYMEALDYGGQPVSKKEVIRFY
jgi:hypothetical protein